MNWGNLGGRPLVNSNTGRENKQNKLQIYSTKELVTVTKGKRWYHLEFLNFYMKPIYSTYSVINSCLDLKKYNS